MGDISDLYHCLQFVLLRFHPHYDSGFRKAPLRARSNSGEALLISASPLHEIKAPFIALIELLCPLQPSTRNSAHEDLIALIAIRRVSRLAEEPRIGRCN